ncbi:cytochrome bd oxidase small subunit CydS [Marinicrinis lubricantis]|uniref:Photosystem II reaction center X protein n=1 Tax=Marinicrinis lubricantis TaxID=2086470 RepID=A0ABW1IR19_9BACL
MGLNTFFITIAPAVVLIASIAVSFWVAPKDRKVKEEE